MARRDARNKEQKLEAVHASRKRLREADVPLKEPDEHCNARVKRRGEGYGYCRNRAGFGTDHAGAGRCKRHGGATPLRSNGRWSKLATTPIGDLVDHFAADPNPTDTLPDIAAMRALVNDYIVRHRAITDALIAWHESFQNPESDHVPKPPRVPDIADAVVLLERVTKACDRVEQRKARNHLSLDDLQRVLAEFGRAVTSRFTVETCQAIADGKLELKDVYGQLAEDWRAVRVAR